MLQMAAGPGGTGQKAQTLGYSVGGKSGTARKQVGKSYATNKYRAWFTGMAPIDKPRIIVAVMIDEPSNGVYYGGAVAAPVFSEVVQQTLRMMGVQPDMASSRRSWPRWWRSRCDPNPDRFPRGCAVAARARHRHAAHRQPPHRAGGWLHRLARRSHRRPCPCARRPGARRHGLPGRA
jgi:membrane peptidoglycan carboxypeptidase